MFVVSGTQACVGYVLTLEQHQPINQVFYELHLNKNCNPNIYFVCKAGEVEYMEDTTVLAELG